MKTKTNSKLETHLCTHFEFIFMVKGITVKNAGIV